jgi:predicted nucleic acid-binding protein
MIVADTSIWISFMRKDDPDLLDIFKKYLLKGHVIGVSAIFGELLQGAKSARENDVINLMWESLPKVDEKSIFIKAGELSSQHKLFSKGVGLIDSYILASCVENNLALWTLDKKLQRAFDELYK